MSVQAGIYPSALVRLGRGIDLGRDEARVALMAPGFYFDPEHVYYRDVARYEVEEVRPRRHWWSLRREHGNGYRRGGRRLAGKRVETRRRTQVLHALPACWHDSTIDAVAAVVYDDTARGKPLLGYQLFGMVVSSMEGTTSIRWDDGGVLVLPRLPEDIAAAGMPA